MYRQQSGQSFNTNSFSGSSIGSQYQGKQQEPYKPVGYVQSQYANSQGQSAAKWSGGLSTFGQNTQSFHTSNYRGNQPGHDQALHSDSNQPTFRSSTGYGAASFQGTQSAHTNQWAQSNQAFQTNQPYPTNQSFQTTQPYSSNQQFQTAQTFHTSNYKGNQPGHDQAIRSDSSQPSSFSSYTRF
ncbi:MAG: hypothetical protein K0Q59_2586 [Paenibacillus sp.]|jgi:hypothetical protein|nr:hypothetical protein [Paenibacillus sp.]